MGELLLDGLTAMVLGIGMVYVFLIIMIYLMKLMSKALAPYANALVKTVSPKRKTAAKQTKTSSLSAEDMLLAQAAIAAVRIHRGGK